MSRRLSRRVVLLGVLSTATMLVPAAHATDTEAGIDTGTFDSGFAKGICGAGSLTRTCTYEIDFTNCQEASANTGTGPSLIIPCSVHFKGSVTVQPRFNAAGRIVGCTSVVDTFTGFAEFNSNIDDDWDRGTRYAKPNIPLSDLTVQSVHPDQSAAIVKFTGTANDDAYRWVAHATITNTSCAPSTTNTDGLPSGSVVVSIAATD